MNQSRSNQFMRRRGAGARQDTPSNSNLTEEPEVSEVVKAFQKYRLELDNRHDRHERIVKESRDITIESKRLIFQMHSIDPRKNNEENILNDVRKRLKALMGKKMRKIAMELQNEEPYQYRFAFTAGVQEFVEAYTFMVYLQQGTCKEDGEVKHFPDWLEIQDEINKTIQEMELDTIDEDITEPLPVFKLDPNDYILGLCDLTGELMRRCINSLGSGDTKTCLTICQDLQALYGGYLLVGSYRCRELNRKLVTMYQSLLKVEQVCYHVKVRGTEAIKWHTMDEKVPERSDDFDEGFSKY